MGIMITKIRIQNFRSIESIEVELENTNILIGQNNCGKTNFLKAIDLSLNSYKDVSKEDIFVKDSEKLTTDKRAIIDILIVPINENGKREKVFNEFWISAFTEKWITTDATNGNYVGIRSIVEFDIKKSDYGITRKKIIEWNSDIEVSKVGKAQQFGSDMNNYINSFFMDAQRDISDDLKSKKSYFGKTTLKTDISPEKKQDIEKQLNDINDEIINSIPSLKQAAVNIAKIGKTLGNKGSDIQIEPLARSLGDLHKGMDITLKDGNAAKFSIAQHGMGTRSWISFLTLGAYVEEFHKEAKNDDADVYVMLTLEEPEAHLHPQAQRQLYSQIEDFRGQKVVSTHSPSVVAQSELKNLIHFYKENGITKVQRFLETEYEPEEIMRIRREVIKTRGELLFSSGIILCEGITEEQALPIYFKEYFGVDPVFLGINIIGVDGQNYKTFLNLIKNFGIKWYIFSDGEKEPIKGVKNAVKVMSDQDISELKNVIILDNGEDFEKYLVKSGYSEHIINAVNEVEEKENELAETQVEGLEQVKKTFFEKYSENAKESNDKHPKRRKTDKPPCNKCGQDIYEDVVEVIDGLDEAQKLVYKCITAKKAKAKYAMAIAEHIVKNEELILRIPSKILSLFKEISIQQGIKAREEYIDDKSIGETAANS